MPRDPRRPQHGTARPPPSTHQTTAPGAARPRPPIQPPAANSAAPPSTRLTFGGTFFNAGAAATANTLAQSHAQGSVAGSAGAAAGHSAHVGQTAAAADPSTAPPDTQQPAKPAAPNSHNSAAKGQPTDSVLPQAGCPPSCKEASKNAVKSHTATPDSVPASHGAVAQDGEPTASTGVAVTAPAAAVAAAARPTPTKAPAATSATAVAPAAGSREQPSGMLRTLQVACSALPMPQARVAAAAAAGAAPARPDSTPQGHSAIGARQGSLTQPGDGEASVAARVPHSHPTLYPSQSSKPKDPARQGSGSMDAAQLWQASGAATEKAPAALVARENATPHAHTLMRRHSSEAAAACQPPREGSLTHQESADAAAAPPVALPNNDDNPRRDKEDPAPSALAVATAEQPPVKEESGCLGPDEKLQHEGGDDAPRAAEAEEKCAGQGDPAAQLVSAAVHKQAEQDPTAARPPHVLGDSSADRARAVVDTAAAAAAAPAAPAHRGNGAAKRPRTRVWPASARPAGGWLVDDGELRALCDTVAAQERELAALRGLSRDLRLQVASLRRENSELRAQREEEAAADGAAEARCGQKRTLGALVHSPAKRLFTADAAAAEDMAVLVRGLEAKVEAALDLLVEERGARKQLEALAQSRAAA